MSGRKLVVAAVLLALVQVGFLSWMIAGRAAILRNGREVLLKVEPVDPRDLLRGDYVRLGYEIGSVPVKLLERPPADGSFTQAGPVFVRLGKDGDGFWRARSASLGVASSSPAAQGEVDIRGDVSGGQSLAAEAKLIVNYGIDRFYVPEGEGWAIEAGIRDRVFAILAAIGNDGTPQIKALVDGDTRLYQEPLY